MPENARSLIIYVDELFKRVEKSLNEIFRSGLMTPTFDVIRCCLEPLVEITETTEEITIVYDLPFIKDKNAIEIHATPNSLEIDAKFAKPVRFEKWGTVQKGTDFKHFQHTIKKLPAEVIPEKASSRFKQGLLEIRLPKVKPFKIKIE